ncbi:hypothetical protein [Arthrobacter sp. 9MFCol3.1]|nr:hypothetical protein [Arthrobacter sp. 9MFCol3.1]
MRHDATATSLNCVNWKVRPGAAAPRGTRRAGNRPVMAQGLPPARS